ncbi:MAG TPA: metallopeptidase TldD-related protein [Candidatus Eremiobacteraeota bacterium]|nr:MAG: peptidase PmbA [bacterium ADurb.Bin363]HPZ09824.1 metallopeptidase TldD-related protein [Candidatus Eremiobacteraeota bacterium]
MNIDLKKKLASTPGIYAWQYKIKNEHSYQLYLTKEQIEYIRKVQTEQIEIVIYKKLDDGKLGEAIFYLTPVEEFQIDEKLEKALYIAGLAAQKPFKLAKSINYKTIPLLDEELIKEPEKVIQDFRERIIKAVKKEKEVELSSSECYISRETTYFVNSRGCSGEIIKSMISWDFVLLSGDNLESESWYEGSCCHHSQLDIEGKIAEYAHYARDNVKTKLPRTSKTAIVINAKTLLPLFEPLIAHSSGKFIYDNISIFKKGKPIFRGDKLRGEELNMAFNPLIPYGLRSSPFDSDGVALDRIEIIKNGKLENIWSTKRYADYLEIPPTGRMSNIEISHGTKNLQELLKAEDCPIYHIVMFSFLNPDLASGDFATEIRFGYEIHPSGKRIPIKGGSITGNIFEMLANAYFSREIEMEGNYFGPGAVKFNSVSISGS